MRAAVQLPPLVMVRPRHGAKVLSPWRAYSTSVRCARVLHGIGHSCSDSVYEASCIYNYIISHGHLESNTDAVCCDAR